MEALVPTVLLTGTIGAGKTAVGTQMVDILDSRGAGAAAIDLDWLGWVSRSARGDGLDHLIFGNLSAVWGNFRAAGADYFVLMRALQGDSQLAALRRSIPAADVSVVRLLATPATIRSRLRHRDRGPALEEHLAQAVEFDNRLEAESLEDHRVSTEGRSVPEVAAEVLNWLGWTRDDGD